MTEDDELIVSGFFSKHPCLLLSPSRPATPALQFDPAHFTMERLTRNTASLKRRETVTVKNQPHDEVRVAAAARPAPTHMLLALTHTGWRCCCGCRRWPSASLRAWQAQVKLHTEVHSRACAAQAVQAKMACRLTFSVPARRRPGVLSTVRRWQRTSLTQPAAAVRQYAEPAGLSWRGGIAAAGYVCCVLAVDEHALTLAAGMCSSKAQ